jgi:hypothetical protein
LCRNGYVTVRLNLNRNVIPGVMAELAALVKLLG